MISPVAAFDGHMSGERAEVNEASDEESCEVGACRSLPPALSVAESMRAVIVAETFIESSIASFTDLDVKCIDPLELYQW